MAGSDLLLDTYNNIVNNVPDEELTGEKMMKALKYIVQKRIDAGYTHVEDVIFKKDSKELFGLDDTYVTTAKTGGCKWYQIGCMLSAVWNWLAGDANGEAAGTTTNGTVLSTVISIISGIIAIITKL